MALLLRCASARSVGNLLKQVKVYIFKYDRRLFNSTKILNQLVKRKLPFEADTNVIKDVILYKHENARTHKILSFFAVGQCMFWVYLSHFAYTCLRDTPVKNKEEKETNELPFWRKINFGENKYRYGLTILCASLGYFILAGAWLFSYRSVRGLVLLRGGERVKIVTYTPFARQRTLQVPLDEMTCLHSRYDAGSYMAIKLKGYYMYFLIDKKGVFTNRQLFDYTAGVKRFLK